MKALFKLFLIALLFGNTILVNAQIIGGSGNGESSPKEVKASELSAGGVSADVNLFTGTLSSGYSLGTVSTPTGLSYTASLSYSSTFATGDNVPHLTGVPYGDGWSLDLPTISVSVEDYNKYSIADEFYLSREGSYQKKVYYPGGPESADPDAEVHPYEMSTEGRLFWYAPQLSIPGVASGRMVFKYEKNSVKYFVLHKFERYVEAIFSGQTWTVIADDGTRYHFEPTVISHREASNQRVHPHRGTFPNYYWNDIKNLVMPKTEYLTWYCTRISHPDKVGDIDILYNLYGPIDFHKVYKQKGVQNGLQAFMGELSTLKTVYRDVYIKEINAGGLEKLVFNYNPLNPVNGADLLDPNDPGVTKIDDLYYQKLVYDDNNLQNWKRYKHPKGNATDAENYGILSSSNPYLAFNQDGGEGPPIDCPQVPGVYLRENVTENNFNHGFLESPRLDPNNGTGDQDVVMPPGDLYAVQTHIRNTGTPSLYDINIATGDFSQGAIPNAFGNLQNCTYQRTRGENVFSTFNRAVKWGSHNGPASTPNEIVTYDVFTLPPLPRQYNGFNIQVGPANSDHNFQANSSPSGALNDFAANLCETYWNYGHEGIFDYVHAGTTDDATTNGLPYYTDPVPNNFGIGAPWHMMRGFYSASNSSMSYCETSGGNNFWWANPMSGYQNQPTAADGDARLLDVKIYRIAKVPLMLTSVQKMVFNTGAETLSDPINDPWHILSNLKLEYDLQTAPVFNRIQGPSGVINQQSNYDRNIMQLVRIRQIEKDIVIPESSTDLTVPTTHFAYQEQNFENLSLDIDFTQDLGFTNALHKSLSSNYWVLNQITNPLGKKTEIIYAPLSGGEITGANSYVTLKYQKRPTPQEMQPSTLNTQYKRVTNNAFQIHMLVSEKRVTDRNGEKLWTYAFGTTGFMKSDLTLPNNYQWDWAINYQIGFADATVIGPAAGTINQYQHSTDYFYWGKVKSTSMEDAAGNRVSASSVTYDKVLAFEPANYRMPRVVDNLPYYDYLEYEDDNRPLIEYNYINHDYVDSFKTYIQQQGVISLLNWIQDNPKPDGFTTVEDLMVSCDKIVDPNLDIDEVFQQDVYGMVHIEEDELIQLTDQNDIYPCSCFGRDYYLLTAEDKVFCTAVRNWLFYYASYVNNAQGTGDNFNHPDIKDQNGTFDVPYYYETRFVDDIFLNDPIYLNSYFIKKTEETSTAYDLDCDELETGIESKTTYEYFDADYKGIIQSSIPSSSGFAEMGIEPSDNRLYWEPSWQLYKKKTTMPSMPGFEETVEYFYYYDLVNHDDYIQSDSKKPRQDLNMLVSLFNVRKTRALAFQQRTTKSTPGDAPIVQSSYYIYSNDWDPELVPYTYVDVENPYGTECADFYAGDTPGCVVSDTSPGDSYCFISNNIWCPCVDEDDGPGDDGNNLGGGLDDGLGGGGNNNNNDNQTQDDDDDETGGEIAYNDNFLAGKFYLQSVYVQVEEEPNQPIPVFNSDLDDPDFGIEVLRTYHVHTRDKLGLVVLEEDEKGLKTKYDYGQVIVAQFPECINGFSRTGYQILSANPALPKSITVGESLPNALTTHYTYYEDNLLKDISDPNKIKLGYVYDGYNRMIEGTRNGQVIQSVQYSNWKNTEPLFKNKALQNFVGVTNYVTGTKAFGTKAYVDPIGRKVGTVSFSTHDGSVLAEDNFFDIYDRPILKNEIKSGSQPTVVDAQIEQDLINNCTGAQFAYDPSPRDRVTQASKYGMCLIDGVSTSYCLVPKEDLLEDLSFAGVGTSIVNLYVFTNGPFYRTETEDEDGKRVIEYADPLGRKVASLANMGSNAHYHGRTATLFKYDSHGNVSEVRNPKGQISTYTYNYLGQMARQSTVDGGESRFAYNPSGQLMLEEDATNAKAAYIYDAFGRMVQQLNPSGDGGLFDNDGLPWVIDPALINANALVNGGVLEKEWFYDTYDVSQNNYIDDDAMGFISQGLEGIKGKVAHSISYNDNGVPVEYRFNSYDADGFLDWQISQTNLKGIPTINDLTTRINYFYNLQGTVTDQEVDLDCDGTPEFNYNNEFDSRNRIKEVYISYPEGELVNYKVATYDYHSDYLTVSDIKYYDREVVGGEVCPEEMVDHIVYMYDERQRLTDINSKLFEYHLAYDGETIETGHSNRNGNINGTIANYKLSIAGEVPPMFSGPTRYGYQYDAMNRLTKADAKVIYDFEGIEDYGGDIFALGDLDVLYDKVGNITTLERGIINDAATTIGTSIYGYRYQGNTNKIDELEVQGIDPNNGSIYSFEFWANGNLKSNPKKSLSNLEYSRRKYAKKMGDADYLYSVNDERIGKLFGSGRKDYYIRNAMGQELAVSGTSTSSTTWYIFGNERIAKIGINSCGIDDQICRPDAPECDPVMLAAQQQQLANMTYQTNAQLLEYPTKLFRVQFCDDSERYLLLDEFVALEGNYNLLQQIDLTESNQLLTVTTENGSAVMLLGDVLSTRLIDGQVDINGYSPCRITCPRGVFDCDETRTALQFSELTTLHSNLLNTDVNTLALPDILLRLRFCDGMEAYVLKQHLDQITGNFTILQQIPVSSVTQTFTVSVDGGLPSTVDLNYLRGHLADPAKEVNIDDYEVCLDGPCDPNPPTCSELEIDAQMNALVALEQAFDNATTGSFTYPTRLYRVRLCSGQEMYVFQSERSLLEGNYLLLQEKWITNPAITVNLELNDGQIQDFSLNDLLVYRRQGSLVSVDGYQSCAPTYECETPYCSPVQVAQQETELNNLVASWPSLTVGDINLPATLYRVRFCEGRELYVFDTELNSISGGRNIQQEILIESTTQQLNLVNNHGYLQPGNLAALLDKRSNDDLLTIGNFIPCDMRSQQPDECVEGCSAQEISDQKGNYQNLLDQMQNGTPPGVINNTFRRVRFCEGQELYVLNQELDDIVGPVHLLQEVPVSRATDVFNVFYNGQSTTATATQILNLRWQHSDFSILGYGCEFEGGPGICTYTIYLENPQVVPIQNTNEVNITVDQVVYQDCGNGSEEYSRESITQSKPTLRGLTLSMDELADKAGYIKSVTLNTRNPLGNLEIILSPYSVLSAYPGLNNVLNTSDLIYDATNPDKMRNAVQFVIEYAIEEWVSDNNLSQVLYDIEVIMTPNPASGVSGFYLTSLVHHDPNVPYVGIADNSLILGYPDGQNPNSGQLGYQEVNNFEIEVSAYISSCSIELNGIYGLSVSYLPAPGDPSYWYIIQPILNSFTLEDREEPDSETCDETVGEIVCGDPIGICQDGTCGPCISTLPDDPICSAQEQATLNQELVNLDAAMRNINSSNLPYPNILYRLRFCGGIERHVFDFEFSYLTTNYYLVEAIPITSADDLFRLTDGSGNAQIAGVATLLNIRRGNSDLDVEVVPPIPGDPQSRGGDEGGEDGSEGIDDPVMDAGNLQVSYFIHDHLGNTRIIYHTTLNCAEDEINYVPEHVIDYYPYGKVLREYVACAVTARYMTTHHERDEESGLDYRGARFYDSDIGRFLSLDPLAAEFPAWSDYNYVLGNPVILVDPDGKEPEHIYDQQADGTYKKREGEKNDGGENFHTYHNNDGSVLHHNVKEGTFVTYNKRAANKNDSELRNGWTVFGLGLGDGSVNEPDGTSEVIIDEMLVPAGGGASSTFGAPNTVATLVNLIEGVRSIERSWTRGWEVKKPTFDSPMTTYDGTKFEHNGRDTITKTSKYTTDTSMYIKYEKTFKKDSIRIIFDNRN